MSIFHAIVLGLVQGLTEFLPISSSGHLILTPWLFGWNDFSNLETQRAFDAALHLGTLVAVLFYLRADLVPYVREGVRVVIAPKKANTAIGRRAWMFVLSAVPAGIAGALAEDWITKKLGTPALIAISLMVFGVVLVWADRQTGKRDLDSFSTRDALLIGAAQVLALNPGTSRSGITITAARKFGFSRDAAARISFLMSVPVIGGAVLLKLTKLASDGIPDGLLIPMIVGIISAGISGWIAMWGMIRLLRSRSFTPFVMYRFVAGIAVLALLSTSFR
ncbi:MAG: undecaprenyl-diphosphatase [Actinomycetota bacterium]|jgi:undecaprenyl-diphosphatase